MLTEFAVSTPQGPVALTKAIATFEQKGFPAATAVDGKTGGRKNGWAISGGGVGSDQAIYFTLAEPLVVDAATSLTCTLRFDYGDHHTLGKFRLSTTTAPGHAGPAEADLPKDVLAALRVEAVQRNDAKKRSCERTIGASLLHLKMCAQRSRKP